MPDKSKYRAIYVNPEIYAKLKIVKAELKEQNMPAFGSDVIGHLLEMKSQVENLEKQYLEALNNIHHLEQQIISLVQVKASFNHPSNQSSISHKNPVLNPPPGIVPPPSLKKNKAVTPIIPTYNVKSDLIQEMNAVMQGKFIRPSEIVKITRPKFASIE